MVEPARPIDLRSDTVTRPSPAMRRAMAEAPVGDDQYGEDPSVNRLQERVAERLGKEAALFVPSGTMSNQIALKLLTRPGDEVILGEDAHMIWHEAGAGAANSGVQFTAVGRGGLFSAAEFGAALKRPGHIVLPPTGLAALDNNVARLAEDHANARVIAEQLTGVSGIRLDLATVQTNIVICLLEEGFPDASAIAARAKEASVLVSALGPRTVRAVTHLDVSRADCERAVERLVAIIRRG